MTSREAYVNGLTLGITKHGGLERLEQSNASLMKIGAALCKLHRKGRLKKSAKLEKLAIDWGTLLRVLATAGGAGAGAAGAKSLLPRLGALGKYPGLAMGLGGALGGAAAGIPAWGLSGRGAAPAKAAPAKAEGAPEFMTPEVMEYLKSRGVDVSKLTKGKGKGPSPYQPTQQEEMEPWQRYMGLRGPGEFAARNQAMLAGLGRRTQAQQTADWLRGMFAPL